MDVLAWRAPPPMPEELRKSGLRWNSLASQSMTTISSSVAAGEAAHCG